MVSSWVKSMGEVGTVSSRVKSMGEVGTGKIMPKEKNAKVQTDSVARTNLRYKAIHNNAHQQCAMRGAPVLPQEMCKALWNSQDLSPYTPKGLQSRMAFSVLQQRTVLDCGHNVMLARALFLGVSEALYH